MRPLLALVVVVVVVGLGEPVGVVLLVGDGDFLSSLTLLVLSLLLLSIWSVDPCVVVASTGVKFDTCVSSSFDDIVFLCCCL